MRLAAEKRQNAIADIKGNGTDCLGSGTDAARQALCAN
jgi:hypothetical protein